jgi:hypothetical protein
MPTSVSLPPIAPLAAAWDVYDVPSPRFVFQSSTPVMHRSFFELATAAHPEQDQRPPESKSVRLRQQGVRHMARRLQYGVVSWPSRGAVIALGIVVSGCTVTSNGMTPNSVTIRTPGTLPNIPTASTPGTPVPPPSGTFSGVAQLSSSPSSGCRRELAVRNFVVTGNNVRFQAFRGTIQPDGYLEMQAGNRFLYGTFNGGRFIGSLWQPHPNCTYSIALNHEG